MKIRRAVVTAAGREQRRVPLQSLVDRDGTAKSALRLLLDEAARAGVADVAVVAHPDDFESYAAAAGDPGPRVHFVPQREPKGYAHALLCARDFAAGEPVLHLVGDHLFVARGAVGAAQEVVAVAESEDAAVSAVQPTREAKLRLYGTIGGTRVSGKERLFTVDAVLEKPTPTEAEQKLFVPGLRAGHYLCFFGVHALPAEIFELIEESSEVSLTAALAKLPGRMRWLALEADAMRIDLGEKYGLLTAQLALALSGVDRDEVLVQLTELLAARERARAR
jgi:UTP--glucose-1-phosphate uridylyltransferase